MFLKIIEENTFREVVGGQDVQKYFSISTKEDANEHLKVIKTIVEYNKQAENK